MGRTMVPILPSFGPCRGDGESVSAFPYRACVPAGRGVERRRPFYQALVPVGAVRDRCGFSQTDTAMRYVPKGQSPCGVTTTTNTLFHRNRSSVEGRHHDRRLSRRDTSSVEGHHHDGQLVPQGQKLGRKAPPRQMPCPVRDKSPVETAFPTDPTTPL